ncbi:MAG: VOC family protein [Candidatus Puniceispirillaceae bacterium]
MITALDHLVMTVRDIQATISFYEQILGMLAEEFVPATGGVARTALFFGAQKINLHEAAAPFRPHAGQPCAGSQDLCFLSDRPVAYWQTHLAGHNVPIEEGPVMRSGAQAPICSIYILDPDGNLIEIGCPPANQQSQS